MTSNLNRTRLFTALGLAALASSSLAGGGSPLLSYTRILVTWNTQLFPQAGSLKLVAGEARREEPSFFAPTHFRLLLQAAPSAYGIETELNIYPLADLLHQYPETTDGSVRQQIQKLRSLIAKPATLNTADVFHLPAVEVVNSSLTVASARKSLSTASLSGVRYLGTFSQDVSRFANTDVRYLFQGLSRDGQYLITLNASFAGNKLPSRSALEAQGYDVAPQPNGTAADQARYERAVKAYFQQTAQILSESGTAPEVRRLDQLVLSLKFN
ncbi:hypothetical protein FNU79_10810 [Deinococcus detaillensis]|uniref:Uncharacterized protein n=1 Tax=Deinococcus detaillensis TaxID=2592048 RepID=A0A553UW70_9DEIO|nr:hypothetical protein [Deinococcus detaillensis]TSA84453.1 hypothetical protein FNU79_10810 [Deinococcus detaillensis]